MNKKFLSWLAGFWEGEGSFTVRPYKTRKGTIVQQCSFNIAQANKDILEYIKTELSCGSVHHSKTKKTGKPMFYFTVSRREYVIKIVKEILPFTKFRTLQLRTKLKLVEDYYGSAKFKLWTKAELSFLRKNYKLPASEIALTIKRDPQSIRAMRKRLGLLRQKSHKYWTEEELLFLKVNYLTMDDKQLSKVLHRKVCNIAEKRSRLDLNKTKRGRPTKWQIF